MSLNHKYPVVKTAVLALVLALPALRPLGAQTTTGATFGEVISLGGTPSDVVLDELRGRLYLVNDKTDRVDVFDYAAKRVVTSIQVGRTPLAAAISMDSAWLYVTNNGNSTLSVIDLSKLAVSQSVLLPSRPEGVEVGADGRVLVSMVGTGVISGVPAGHPASSSTPTRCRASSCSPSPCPRCLPLPRRSPPPS